MTQEQKAKAYDEALERAKKCLEEKRDAWFVRPDVIFPELKESDEIISKEIIYFLDRSTHQFGVHIDKYKSWVAWLEKQGKQKSCSWKPTEEQFETLDYAYNSCSDTERGNYYEGVLETLIEDLHRLEKQDEYKSLDDVAKEVVKDKDAAISFLKSTGIMNENGELADEYKIEQGEQKPFDHENATIVQHDFVPKSAMEAIKEEKVDNANKVEPKFKVGDWVVRGDTIAQILDIQEQYYVGLDINGKDFTSSRFLNADKIHLWTIQDAKDGDVLVASDGSIFIFAGVIDCACKYYVALAIDNYVKINKEANGGYWETSRAVYPATKEQRGLLLQKMKEAGYSWDADKKESKKIEQNPTWSEEDEDAIGQAIVALEDMFDEDNPHSCYAGYKLPFIDAAERLKSLKDRYT